MITRTIKLRSAHGHVQEVYGELQFSGSYPSGGDILRIGDLAIGTIKKPVYANIDSLYHKYLYVYDVVGEKVLVGTQGTPAQGVIQITAGPYPAEVISDLVTYIFVFPKF